MNYDQPPPRNWTKVVAFVLGGLALLFVALLSAGYYVVMHTSAPFKMIESMLSQGGTNEPFKVEGVSGSIAKGFRIKSITWGEQDKGASQIEDVRVLYSNFWELMGGRRVIFKEIHIGKAHLDVTGIEELMSPTNSVDSEVEGTNEDGTNAVTQPNVSVWSNSPAWRTSARRRPARRLGNDLFEIDKLSVEDVFITNRVTGFSLSVPAVEWKGFKAMGQKVELGELTINSDRLKVETKAGETVAVNGEQVTFQKKLEGTILPRLHKSVRQPISFRIDAGHTGSSLVWRLSSFEGRLEAYRGADDRGFVSCRDADLTAYFDAPVPEHLIAEATMKREGTRTAVKLGKGSFMLGVSRFDIPPQQWEKTEGVVATNHLIAVNRSGDSVISYNLLMPDEPWKAEQRLTSEPFMTSEDLLARVFYGKNFGDLGLEEQKALETKKAGFAGWGRDSKVSSVKDKVEKAEAEK
jgi:hypothetical protein